MIASEYKHLLHVPTCIYMYMYISVLYLRSILQYTSNAIDYVPCISYQMKSSHKDIV